MTPKAQQISNYELQEHNNNNNNNLHDKKDTCHQHHQRNPSQTSTTSSELFFNTTQDNVNQSQTSSSASLLLYSLSNRVTSVISPAVVFMIATPIAMQYPLLQLIMFLTILVGTSPLYFILITFIGKSHKQYSSGSHFNHNKLINPQPHRRQPSIVGSISEMTAKEAKK